MELFRALAMLAEAPNSRTEAIAATLELQDRPDPSQYTDLFVLQLWPYASIYVGGEGKLGGEARDRVAGFWRALRITPPAEPDHLSALLGLYATLVESEAAEGDAARRLLLRRSRKALLWEHLLCWLPPYLVKLNEVASPFYRAWGQLLGEALISQAIEVGTPDEMPVHLREAPGLALPEVEGAEAFLSAVLAPARSGMLLVRDDWARAADELALGLRQGERRYVFQALLAQDPAHTLAWLANEGRRWSAIHSATPPELAPVRDFWIGRAEATAEQLGARIPA